MVRYITSMLSFIKTSLFSIEPYISIALSKHYRQTNRQIVKKDRKTKLLHLLFVAIYNGKNSSKDLHHKLFGKFL